MNGKCVSSVQILIKTDKKSFLYLYNLLIQFLTLVTSLILISSLTENQIISALITLVFLMLPLIILW